MCRTEPRNSRADAVTPIIIFSAENEEILSRAEGGTGAKNLRQKQKSDKISLTMILYHGSPNKIVVPQFGLGQDRHDYGKGFYLTQDLNLAKEWAVCRPETESGYVHSFEFDAAGLNIFDYEKENILCWLSELMKHRDAADSKRYRMLAAKFIEKFGKDTSNADVIKGWRANASYFYIAKAFVRDEVDIDILEELMQLGGLGIQWCVKSEKAFGRLKETTEPIPVDWREFNAKYNERDADARNKMKALIDSDKNKVTKVFSTLVAEESK